MNKALLQSNLLTLHEIYTRTELWKDKIYFLSHNPYKFPKNDGSGDFLPLPKRFAEIITEFKEEVNKQKQAERPEAERQQAQQRISEIYQEIKKLIQARIEEAENYQNEIEEQEIQEAQEKNEEVEKIIKDIQAFFQQEYEGIKHAVLAREIQHYIELEPFLKETDYKKFKEWEEKHRTITKTEIVEESDDDLYYFEGEEEPKWQKEREIDLLEEWEELNGGQPPIKDKEKIQQSLLKEQEKNRQEYLKQLKLGLNKKTISQLQKFNTEHLDENEEVAELLTEWEEQRKIVSDRKNICFILEDNDEYLKFCYQPPRGIFANLKDFLFYRNNIWYEVLGWERINHENAIITAQRSIFIHYYPTFWSQGANGVIHHSPKFGNKDEICQCPSFLESTEYAEFTSDWQPSYKLWKLKNFMGGMWRTELHNKPYGQDRKYPVFHTLDLEEAGSMETQGLTPTTYFLLPDWYQNGSMTGGKKFKIQFSNSAKTTLDNWVKNAKMERMGHDGQGGKYEHLLKHVNVNYFWNSKKVHESNLDEMDWNNFNVFVRANPAGIMYRFESKKVLFRYSEDLNFSLEADKMQGLALKMGTKILDGAVKALSLGTVDPKTSGLADDLKDTTNKYLHNKKGDKSKDERQGERKKTLAAATSGIMQTVMGSVPSLLDASHTHGDYSLGEIALRFDSINFWIRLEFNKSLCHRYQMMKVLKKNGNQVFNVEKFGNILAKGYYKIVPNIFEGDKNGFFAGLFNRGVYLYEEHPHEYFLEKGETGKFERGVLNKDPVMTNTTIQINHTSAIGRDNLVHVDDMSWVWKDSYLRPVGGGGGTDLFPQMINDGRKHIKVDDGAAWKFDGYAQWSSKPLTIPPNIKCEWYMHAFSSGEKSAKNFRGIDDNITVQITQDGADWSLDIMGKVEITETIGNPDAIGSGVEIDDVEELLPDMEDEKQTEGLDNLEQDLQPEGEQAQEKQDEIQDELEPEPEAQKQDEKQEELEPEDEKSKDKQKQKQKDQQKEDEQQDEPEHSRQNEK